MIALFLVQIYSSNVFSNHWIRGLVSPNLNPKPRSKSGSVKNLYFVLKLVGSSSDFSTKNVKMNNKSKYSSQRTKFEDEPNYGNEDFEFETQGTGFKNADPITYKNLNT